MHVLFWSPNHFYSSGLQRLEARSQLLQGSSGLGQREAGRGLVAASGPQAPPRQSEDKPSSRAPRLDSICLGFFFFF